MFQLLLMDGHSPLLLSFRLLGSTTTFIDPGMGSETGLSSSETFEDDVIRLSSASLSEMGLHKGQARNVTHVQRKTVHLYTYLLHYSRVASPK